MLINEFCRSRGIPVHFEQMFENYLRDAYDFLFSKVRDYQETQGKARELSYESLMRLWLEFVFVLEAALSEEPELQKETYGTNRTIFNWYPPGAGRW